MRAAHEKHAAVTTIDDTAHILAYHAEPQTRSTLAHFITRAAATIDTVIYCPEIRQFYDLVKEAYHRAFGLLPLERG